MFTHQLRSSILITLSFLIILCFVSAKTDSINPQVNKVNMKITNEKFVGSWELVEWIAEFKDESIIFPFGEDARGQIHYYNNGNMSVQIMRNNRSRFFSDDPLQAQPDEMAAAYNGFIAYCGKYEVNLSSNQVVHKIEISSFPNWVGQNQIRYYEFDESKLILSTDFIGLSRHKLTWKKTKS